MKFIFALLIIVFGAGLAPAVELDSEGCRDLSPLPEPGVHPRVFFTADEYPLMKERLNAPNFKRVFGKVQDQVVRGVYSQWGEFAAADMSNPTDEEILKYFVSGEGRNQSWGIASLVAVLNDDAKLKETMINVIVNYAHIILASKERAIGGEQVGKTGIELNKKLSIWKTDSFDVGVSWTLGSAGYPLAYDVLYNDMTSEQRKTVEKAIAAATKGRKSYGNGMPRGFATSNHYGYHGDLAALLAVIEGTPGFDKEAWNGICQVMKDYWEVGFNEDGSCREDGYGPNLGLRAGSRAYMIMARRGYNIFDTQKYRNYLKYVALDYDPYPGGQFNGGASGGPYDELYPSSTIIARYMYPDNIAANFDYRQLIGEEYERRLRWQGFLDFMIYGSDWKGPADREEMLSSAGLPLNVYYPARGKFITRSDWSNDAMYLTLDARPDGHLIGHDKTDRGNFSMSALGRVWAFSGDFRVWNESMENSLVHIDGKSQGRKAPSVNMLWVLQNKNFAGAAADLEYAYDWEWTPPWPKWGTVYNAPWEPEKSTPEELGWPKEHLIPEFEGSIYGSQTGYGGCNNMHRRPYNSVEKAIRSAFLIKGKHPYTIICDDIKKDNAKHLYEWVMQLPTDLVEVSRAENQIILGEAEGDRRLLVRFLQNEICEIKTETYVAYEDTKRGTVTQGQRLIASVDTVEPKFKVMLFPFRKGEPLPVIKNNKDYSRIIVNNADQVDNLSFSEGNGDGVRLDVK